MLFNTAQFAIFLALVLGLVAVAPRRFSPTILLASSLVFYALWVPVLLVLLGATIGVNYAFLQLMVAGDRRRFYLGLSIFWTLGLLVYFKYAALVIETLAPALSVFGVQATAPEILLPLGISFYSFQIIALSVDVYRGRVEPVTSLSRYALFVCFFPQLIAGPIVRGWELLPQLAAGGERTGARTRAGVWLIAAGVVKKMVFADFLLAEFVETAFNDPLVGSAGYHWVAAYGFAFQIYFDFSGYSDMARGMAKLLGYELPFNFKEPYLSRDPSEFWRRWHITLSEWLRDYLYIPLGGNRRGRARTYLNLFLTMLLGGLWHGAAWTFVVWGGLHGLLLAVHRLLGRPSAPRSERVGLSDLPRILLLFHGVCVIWVFFRADSFGDAWIFLVQMFTGSFVEGWPLAPSLVVLLSFGLHLFERVARIHAPQIQQRFADRWWGMPLEGAVLGAITTLAVLVTGGGGEFIYFQF